MSEMKSEINRKPGMQYSEVASLAATPSLLGFGAMRLPLGPSGEPEDVDIETTCRMIDTAMAGGVNYFDTAYGYHKERSEDAIRQALVERYDRRSFYLADKLAVFLCQSADDQAKMFETQLARCGVDYFDFYLVHAISQDRYERCLAFRTFDFVKDLKESGRARRIGFSFHDSPERLSRVLDAHPEFEFVQLQINYLDWRAQRASECYRIAHERGLSILVMEPVKGGSLANLVPTAASLSPLLGTPAMQAAFALKFAASLDGVMTVLSGMTTLDQVEANVRTFQNPAVRKFGEEEMRLADHVLEETRKISQVPCTACGYCLEACPVGIEIPKIFAIYNELKRGGAVFHAQYSYSCIKNGHRADSCIKCGACVEKCPQGIDIPTELEALHTEIPLMALVPQGTK